MLKMKKNMEKLNFKLILNNFKDDKVKHSNVIIDILEELENENPKEVLKAIATLQNIFTILLKDGSMLALKTCPDDLQTAKEKYNLWLYARYNEVHTALCKLLHHAVPQVQEKCLHAAVKLLQREAFLPIAGETYKNNNFPEVKLQALINVLASAEKMQNNLIKHLEAPLENPVLKYNVLKALYTRSVKDKTKTNEFLIANIFSCLELIKLPEVSSANNPVDQGTEKDCKRYFNLVWEYMFKCSLPQVLFQRCLTLFPAQVMPHLYDPVILTDFYMEAFALGGATSVLALEGIYILVAKHDLEYPKFYDKVYSMMEPSIFNSKYKARFFLLCYQFLSSKLVPEYYLTAFLKRVSRLVLVAPTSSLMLLLRFAVNLLFKNHSLRRLIHCPESDISCIEDDPYLEDEEPANCLAGQSSLWEIASLNQHPLCGISKAASFIRYSKFSSYQYDLSEVADKSYDEMYERADKICLEETATTFGKPTGLFSYPDDQMSSAWSVY